MPSQKAQKFKKVLSLVVEPIALGVLALLFIIPTITVMNLSPITKKLQELNVLGVNTQSAVSVTLVGGKHDVITEENLNKITDTSYEYSTKLAGNGTSSYSKPIIEIKNNTDKVQKVSFYGQTLNSIKSNIYLKLDDDNTNKKLQDDKGQTYTQEITINPSSKVVVFLSVESLANVNFSEEFNMQIKVVENL
jgi:hypothetical protein